MPVRSEIQRRANHFGRLIWAGLPRLWAVATACLAVVGGSVVITLAWSVKHLLWGLIAALAIMLIVITEGSYRMFRTSEEDHDTKLIAERTQHQEALEALRVERDAAKGDIERRFAAMRYAFQVKGAAFKFIPGSGGTLDVQIELKITNNSDEHMRYEIEHVSTIIEGMPGADGPVLNRIGVNPPHGTDTFTCPPARGVPVDWHVGSLKLTARYGHRSARMRYRMQQEYLLQASRPPGSPPGENTQVNWHPVGNAEVEDI